MCQHQVKWKGSFRFVLMHNGLLSHCSGSIDSWLSESYTVEAIESPDVKSEYASCARRQSWLQEVSLQTWIWAEQVLNDNLLRIQAPQPIHEKNKQNKQKINRSHGSLWTFTLSIQKCSFWKSSRALVFGTPPQEKLPKVVTLAIDWRPSLWEPHTLGCWPLASH